MTTALSARPSAPATDHAALQHRLAHLEGLTSQARSSLRLWRGVMYTCGLLAVVAAAAAGVSSLGDIWGSATAGLLAIGSAILASVDKFLGAGDKVTRLDRRWQSLDDLQGRARFDLYDAKAAESRLDPAADAAVDYRTWLTERCRSIDADLKAINDRLDNV